MFSAADITSLRTPEVHRHVRVRLLEMVAGMLRLVRRAWCGLLGHEMVQRYEPNRLALECMNCGAETPGWQIDVRPAFRTRPPARARVVRAKGGPAAAAPQLPGEASASPDKARKLAA